MKELIDFLEKKGFIEQANNLKNGALTLRLNKKNIGKEEIKEIARVLENNKLLTSLDLSENKIGAEGAKEVAKVLENNKSLTFLDVSGNQIGAEGTKKIVDVLGTNNKSLTTLCLAGNQIGAEGAKEIARVLENNKSLTSLSLVGNRIGAEGVKEIAEMLRINKSLTSLYLGWNQIGIEGTKKIADVLKTDNFIITTLTLQDGQIESDEEKIIKEYLQRNQNLTKEKEKKVKALNIQGDVFCKDGQYEKIIEKHNEVVTPNKKLLYVTDKANVEKDYAKAEQVTEFNQLKFQQLSFAIKENNLRAAENLVKNMNEYTLSKIDNDGNTLLQIAANLGKEKICELLIPNMTSEAVSHINSYNETALILAVFKGLNNLDKVCELLLPKMTAQAINHINSYNETALTLAAWKGSGKVCELLISRMSKEVINHVNNYGSTAYSLAISNNLKKVTELIKLKMTAQDINTTTFIVNEIVYDKALLNHKELLTAASKKFTIEEIAELSNRLSVGLIYAAIKNENDKGAELILNGLISLLDTIKVFDKEDNIISISTINKSLKEIYELLTLKITQQQTFKYVAEGYTTLTEGVNEKCGQLFSKGNEQNINTIDKELIGNIAKELQETYEL